MSIDINVLTFTLPAQAERSDWSFACAIGKFVKLRRQEDGRTPRRLPQQHLTLYASVYKNDERGHAAGESRALGRSVRSSRVGSACDTPVA